MSSLPRVPGSDDEEDLNALRIAALQSLKRKDGPDTMGLQTNENMLFENSGNFRSHKGHRNKKGRFLVAFSSRGGKPPHFNRDFSRSRNTNLIAITTIPNEGESNKIQNNQEIISTEEKEISKDDINSKFSRYNNSDKSESESDVEQQQHLSGEEGNPGKLRKSNSLEALMLELDNEIKGKTIEGKEVKVRKKNSCESDSLVISDNADKTKVQVENIVTCTNSDKPNQDSTNCSHEITESVRNIYHRELNHVRRKRVKTHRRFLQRHMPQINMFNEGPNNSPGQIIFGPPLPFHPPLIPFPNQPFNSYGPPMMSMPNQLPQPFYTRPLSPLAINTESLTTATLAPLSPRSAAFVLQNKAIIERRKRSPRRSYSRSLSRSPRRSPISPRRSPISPRRSPLSPKRTSRSPRRSPRRRSLSPRRRSLSPYRRSISPRRRKASRNEPLLKNRLAIRERLGAKSFKVGDDKDKACDIVKDNDSLSKDDIESPNKEDKPTRVEKVLDPVFEARRKKFESNEIKKKEGIIRLKPKGDNKDVVSSFDSEINKQSTVLPPIASNLPKKIGCVKEVKLEKEQTIKKIVQDYKKEEKPNNKDEQINREEKCVKVEEKLLKTPVSNSPDQENMKKEINTDVKVPDEFEELEKLLNDNPLPEIDDILQPKVADIFSDEDSGSDNEGRFKANQKDANKVSVIPFTKLRSSTGPNIKTDLSLPLRSARRSRHEPITESSFRRRNRTRVSETRKSPKRETIKNEIKKSIPQDKLPVKNRIAIRRDRYTPPLDRKFERKIEIKIKNPSKYEKSGKSWSSSKGNPDNIQIKEELVEDDVRAVEDEIEPEIIIENDSEDGENSTTNEGDLRAQLSKKRAEKLHRIPVTTVSSRLLKYALEGAVFTKSKKKKSKEKKETLKKELAAIRKMVHADCMSKKICLSFNTERKVTLYKCHNVALYGYPWTDVRVPIHLRLGIANSSDILTDTHVKRKSRKRKSGKVLEQV